MIVKNIKAVNEVWIILTTSILSGLFTSILILGLLYYFIQKKLKKKLEILVDEYIETFKEKLKISFQEAGEELLPKFKEEVKKGFKEAINESLVPSTIDEVARHITKMSTNIIQNSLNLLKPPWDEQK